MNNKKIVIIRRIFFVLSIIGYALFYGFSIYHFKTERFDLAAGFGLSGFIFLQMGISNMEKDTVNYTVISNIAYLLIAGLTILIVLHKAKFGY